MAYRRRCSIGGWHGMHSFTKKKQINTKYEKIGDGKVKLWFYYDQDIVNTIKSKIPYEHRKWDKDERCWIIRSSDLQLLIDLHPDEFGFFRKKTGYDNTAPDIKFDEEIGGDYIEIEG